MYKIASGKLLYSTKSSAWCFVITLGGVGVRGDGGVRGGREAQKGRDIYMLIVDPHCHTAETITTLYSNYTPII